MFRCIPARLVLMILTFFGFINLYLSRYNYSVISVAMITPFEQQHSGVNDTCTDSVQNCNDTNPVDKHKTTLDWDERTRALTMGMFHYGYCFTQILGGRLAERYGSKYVLGAGITLPAVLSFFIPVAAKSSYWGVVVIRFLQGIFQGVTWPSMHALLVHWIPLQERSRFVGMGMLGATFGMVLILPFSGFLCDVFSWEIAFYITAAFPLIWGVFWLTLIYDRPKLHPRISREERAYIESSVTEGGTREIKKRPVPWKSIMTSLPFIALVLSSMGNTYGYIIYASQMPNYLSSVFHFSTTKTGIISGLPFLFRYCGSCTFTCLADYIISRKILTVTTTRKISSAIGMLGPSVILLFIILFALENQTAFVYSICTALFINGSVAASILINNADIAPNYSGTLFGIINTCSSIASSLCLFMTGEILNKEPSLERWTMVFGSVIPVLVFTEIFFLVFMSAVPQSWNSYGEEKHSELLEKPVEEESRSDNISET